VTASRFLGTTQTTLPAVTGGAALPPGFGLVPGRYVFGGVSYDCADPGLYSFFDPVTLTDHRRPMWTGSIPDFIRAMAWVFIHGPRDNALTGMDVCAVAKARRVQMQCGATVMFMRWLLPQVGLAAADFRQVNFWTLTPQGQGDDSHVCFEERSSGTWRLWDLNAGYYYTDASGNHLSGADIVAIGAQNIVAVELRDGPAYAADAGIGTLFDKVVRTPALRQSWRERIFQSVSYT
jgi:hypothetical protein